MSEMMLRIALSGIAAIPGCLFAVRRGMLAPSGAIVAVVLGVTMVACAGWWAGITLVSFFAASSVLGRALRSSDETQVRGNTRDAMQVIANGGVACVGAIAAGVSRNEYWLIAVAGAIAAANADTFSTEIGRTSPVAPRMITTWKPVEAGTSGGVSGRGLTGAAVGGLLIAAVASLGGLVGAWPALMTHGTTFLAIAVGGFCGSVGDSLIGATIQCHRWCPACTRYTERSVHICGTPTLMTHGYAWVTNDVVNIACCAVGAVVAGLFAKIL